MKSQQFEDPRLYAVKFEEKRISGQILLELMRVVLAKHLPFRFRARGWSMSPFIQDGDVITISPLQQTKPRIGEIVAFTRPGVGNLVVHRVVGRQGSSAIVQGDSSPEHPDGTIPEENLLGRVTRIERDGHNVWLGLGPEKIVIAWLSRSKQLIPLWLKLTSWLKPVLRR